jgi:hypothetical protein
MLINLTLPLPTMQVQQYIHSPTSKMHTNYSGQTVKIIKIQYRIHYIKKTYLHAMQVCCQNAIHCLN